MSEILAKLSQRQHCWCILEDFHCQEFVQFSDINCCLFMRLSFTIGCHNRDGVSGNFYCFQFCWIQIFPSYDVHRRSGAHHKFSSSRLFLGGEGRHHFSVGEKNVALCFSFIVNTLLASFHAASRAPCSCHSLFAWDRSLNFGAFRFRWRVSPKQILLSDGFWLRTLASRNMAGLVSAWLNSSVKSMKTSAALPLSTKPLHFLSPFFLDLSLGCSCGTLIPELAPRFSLVLKNTLGNATFHKID